MSGLVVLVRHTDVARAWRGRCYGATDVGLSRDGRAAIAALAAQLAAERPAWVMHSGLTRTRLLAHRVASQAACPLLTDTDWRERDFGSWEGRSWNAIYRESGNAMDGMITAPATFRPGGGETTFDLRDRVQQAWQRLPARSGPGAGIVVTHGGPIAALLGHRRGLPAAEWPKLIPPLGAKIAIPSHDRQS
jgi:broad specificity phosphatase PhoE